MASTDLSLREAGPRDVARVLGPTPPRGFVNPVAWSAVSEVARNGVGEVKSASDWQFAPRERDLRAIALCDEEHVVIRWADPQDLKVREALDGDGHERLVCRGDAPAARSGYVHVTSGKVIVRS